MAELFAGKGLFWIIFFVVFIILAFVLLYNLKIGGISFIKDIGLKDIQWIP